MSVAEVTEKEVVRRELEFHNEKLHSLCCAYHIRINNELEGTRSTHENLQHLILGAFSKLPKSDYNFMSAFMSLRMEQLCSHWTDFD
jgi:hypothetical protein